MTYDPNKAARLKDLTSLSDRIKTITDGFNEQISYLQNVTLILLNTVSPLTLISDETSLRTPINNSASLRLIYDGANNMTLTPTSNGLAIVEKPESSDTPPSWSIPADLPPLTSKEKGYYISSDTVGSYTATFTVEDEFGRTKTLDVPVTILAPIDFGFYPSSSLSCNAGGSVEFWSYPNRTKSEISSFTCDNENVDTYIDTYNECRHNLHSSKQCKRQCYPDFHHD